MTHDGRFLKSEFTFGPGEAKTTGTGTIGFEPTPEFSPASGSTPARRACRCRRAPTSSTVRKSCSYGKTLGKTGNEMRLSRTVTRLEDDGRKIVHRQHNIDPQGQERLAMELVMTRKAAKP